MRTGNLCHALVATLLMTVTGCSDVQTDNEGQSSQAVTGCELDCSNGSVFTCSVTPCSVSGTSLNCNGVITNCPVASGVCGNGILESGEVCDDGNNNSFDSCSPDCQHACTGGTVWCDCLARGHCVSSTQCTRECLE